MKKFREAISKEEQCKVPLMPDWGLNPTYDKLPIEKMRKEYHEYCPKSKSNNIVFCPKKIISRKKDKKVKWINDYFKNFGKKSMKKMYKRKRDKKKKKKKKKSKYTRNNGKDYWQKKEKSNSKTMETVKEIKEQLNNIKDKLNTKFDDINIKVKHDIDIKHDINIKLNDKLEMSTRERKTFKTKI